MDLQSHSGYLLQQLQEQRIQGLLCDCTLVVKGVCFKAHKNVLAAFSATFRSLFQTQKSDVFDLMIQDVSGIGQLLDYMYTSRLDVNAENVLALSEVARCLQMPIAQNLCQSFLKPSTLCPAGGAVSSDHDCPLAEQSVLSDFNQNPPQKTNANPSAESAPPHGYKLRNFYSRQYFRQIHESGGESAENQQPMLNSIFNQQPAPNPGFSQQPAPNVNPSPSPGFNQQPVGNVDPAHHLTPTPNSGFNPQPVPNLNPTTNTSSTISPTLNLPPTISLTFNAPAPPPVLDPPLSAPALPPSLSENLSPSELSRGVRPKKTVYLKKYNYLRPQKTDESALCPTLVTTQELTAPPAAEAEVQQEPGPELESGNPTHDTEASGNHTPTRPLALDPPLTLNSPETQTLDPPEESGPAELPPSGQRQYCCSACGKVFKHPSNLELHKRSHTGEKPFQCNVCGRHFSQAGNLQTHLRRHSGEKPYICELCGKGFTASGDVQRHKVVHTGERPHLCDICGKGFNNMSNLKEHKRTHSTELSFTCDQCGKSFNAPRKLHKHKSRHGGEKPHTCSTCGKSFVGSGDLQRHVRSHTGEKPYVCGECNHSFSRSALVRRHRALHCKGLPLQTDHPPQKTDHQPQKTDNQPLQSDSQPQLPLQTDHQPHHHNDQPQKSDDLPQMPHHHNDQPQLPHQSENQPQIQPSCPESTSLGGREGQLMSSVSLWGLAMKTLQNDTD